MAWILWKVVRNELKKKKQIKKWSLSESLRSTTIDESIFGVCALSTIYLIIQKILFLFSAIFVSLCLWNWVLGVFGATSGEIGFEKNVQELTFGPIAITCLVLKLWRNVWTESIRMEILTMWKKIRKWKEILYSSSKVTAVTTRVNICAIKRVQNQHNFDDFSIAICCHPII